MFGLIVLVMIGNAVAGTSAGQTDANATYSYPPQAAAIPALRRWLTADAAKKDDVVVPPRSRATHAPKVGDAWRVEEWKLVTDTPRFLSMSRWTTEAGGAHPQSWSGSMVWDKEAAVPLSALSFFINSAALDAAVRPAFCRQLAAERRMKRGSFEGGDFATWNDCVDPAEATIMLGSSNDQRFTRIGFRMDPYIAGAYAEGVYEVTLPVTPAILAAVKPEWRRYFAATGTP